MSNAVHLQKIAGTLPRRTGARHRTFFAEGATVPFIARYRKEATGSLDEVADHHHPRPPRPLAELDHAATPSSTRLKNANSSPTTSRQSSTPPKPSPPSKTFTRLSARSAAPAP